MVEKKPARYVNKRQTHIIPLFSAGLRGFECIWAIIKVGLLPRKKLQHFTFSFLFSIFLRKDDLASNEVAAALFGVFDSFSASFSVVLDEKLVLPILPQCVYF